MFGAARRRIAGLLRVSESGAVCAGVRAAAARGIAAAARDQIELARQQRNALREMAPLLLKSPNEWTEV